MSLTPTEAINHATDIVKTALASQALSLGGPKGWNQTVDKNGERDAEYLVSLITKLYEELRALP